MSDRVFYGPILSFHNLNMACRLLAEAFGHCIYLVGSSTERPDYRDVDVRCMLDPATFDAMFPGALANHDKTGRINARLLAANLAFSAYLSQQSSLPVDFQFQHCDRANEEYGDRPRNPMGLERWQRTHGARTVSP